MENKIKFYKGIQKEQLEHIYNLTVNFADNKDVIIFSPFIDEMHTQLYEVYNYDWNYLLNAIGDDSVKAVWDDSLKYLKIVLVDAIPGENFAIKILQQKIYDAFEDVTNTMIELMQRKEQASN